MKDLLINTSMRQAYIAPRRFLWGSLDFSGQELVGAACLSNDRVMLDILSKKKTEPYILGPDGQYYDNPAADLHYQAAEVLFPFLLNVEEHLKISTANDKNKGRNGKSPRLISKIFNFQLIYGASAASLSTELDSTVEEAEVFLEAYFSKFKSLGIWLKNMAEIGKAQHWVRLPTGRVLFIGESNAKGLNDANAMARKGPNAIIQG